jgi:hypothetical protein
MIQQFKKTLVTEQTEITLEKLKAVLQIDYNTEDGLLGDVLKRAISSYENVTGRYLNTYDVILLVVGKHNRPLPGHPIDFETVDVTNGEFSQGCIKVEIDQTATATYQIGGEVEPSDAANVLELAAVMYQSKMVDDMNVNRFIEKNYRSRSAKQTM